MGIHKILLNWQIQTIRCMQSYANFFTHQAAFFAANLHKTVFKNLTTGIFQP